MSRDSGRGGNEKETARLMMSFNATAPRTATAANEQRPERQGRSKYEGKASIMERQKQRETHVTKKCRARNKRAAAQKRYKKTTRRKIMGSERNKRGGGERTRDLREE